MHAASSEDGLRLRAGNSLWFLLFLLAYQLTRTGDAANIVYGRY